MKSILIIAIAVVCLFVPVNVFATHANDDDYSNDPDYEGKTPLRVYTIFASATYFGCGDFDSDKLAFFKMLTTDVLRMYGFLPITSNPYECVKVSGDVEFDKNNSGDNLTYGLTLDVALEKAKDWHYDLLIIIFDDKLSEQYFDYTEYFEEGELKYWGGHIEGTSNTIVSTSDLRQVEEEEGAWILSHELAHFALRYLGNSHNIWVDYVHRIHDEYRECQKIQFKNSDCLQTYSKVKAYGGYFKILKPYEKPVYSQPIIKDSDGDGYADNVDSCPTQRENFNGYQDSDGCPDNPTSNQNKVNPDTFNGLVNDYVNKKTQIKSDISNKLNKYQFLSFESPLGNAKHGYVLNQLRSINFETSDYNINIHSQWWMDGLHSVGENGVREEIKKLYGIANDLKQLDRDIIKAKSLESEFKSKQIQEKKELELTKQTTVKNSMNPSLYVIGADGKKAKETTIKPNERFTVEGYVYNNNVPQKYTSYKILDNIGNSRDGTTNTNGFFKHILTSEHSAHQNFGQGNDESSTTIVKVCVSSNCESVKVYVRGNDYASTSNFDNKSNNQAENVLQNKQESNQIKNDFMDLDKDGIFDSKDLCNTKAENYNGYQDTDGCPDTKPTSKQTTEIKLAQDVRDSQIFAYDEINSLKTDIEDYKKILEKQSSTNSEQQHKISQAWNLLKNAQGKLKEVENRVNKGDTQFGYGNYENAKTFFSNDKMNKRIGDVLKGIPVLVEEVKHQTCFLMWCW